MTFSEILIDVKPKFFQENAFENVVCESAAIPCRSNVLIMFPIIGPSWCKY